MIKIYYLRVIFLLLIMFLFNGYSKAQSKSFQCGTIAEPDSYLTDFSYANNKENLIESEYTLDTHKFLTGIYFIKAIFSNNKSITKKLIIKKY